MLCGISLASVAFASADVTALSFPQQSQPAGLTYQAVFGSGTQPVSLGSYELWEARSGLLGGRIVFGPAAGGSPGGPPAYGGMVGLVWDIPTKGGPTFTIGGAGYLLFSGDGRRHAGFGILAGIKF